MTTQIVGKQVSWSGQINAAGYRTYKIAFKIKAGHLDGPANVMQTPGLYLPGVPWVVDDDVDLWVWCRNDMDCKALQQKDGEAIDLYLVEQTFSNQPLDSRIQRCNDIRIEDPLLEPMKIGGGFVKKTIEAIYDRFGSPVTTSSWEQLRGNQVEFDKSTDDITIEQNVINLELPLVESMKNTVNKFPMWGLPARTVLLSDFRWEEKWYGLCYKYYTRKFTFAIDYNTWDKFIIDEATKVLNGHWSVRPEEGPKKRWILDNIDGSPPDPLNPLHFIRFQDFNGNTTKVILDGFGQPYNPLLNDTVTGCTQCPGGMPRYLQIRLAADSPFQGNFQEQVIAYSSGCLWGNSGMTLEFDTVEDEWVLTDLDTGGIWKLASDAWNCTGDNEMLIDESQTFNEELPVAVEVEPTLSIPGTRLLQYYKESDFTSLGIPLIL